MNKIELHVSIWINLRLYVECKKPVVEESVQLVKALKHAKTGLLFYKHTYDRSVKT